mgnify:CR=1 FL=1
MYLRQNIVQAVIGEFLGVCRPTASRAIKALTEAISRTPAVLLLTAEEVPEDCDYVVDGTLLPCSDWRRRRDPWSVKHGRAGMNVQILVRPNGGFVWAPGPLSGVHARRGRTGRLRIARGNGSFRMDRRQGLYRQGGDHTAQEAPKGELDEKAKEENRSVNKIRQVVERTIAHIKSWRILHAAYRRPLETFEQTITAALALYSFKTTP